MEKQPQTDPPQETEAELERFRKQWQEEVARRNRQQAAASSSSSTNTKGPQPGRRKSVVPPPGTKALSRRPDLPEGYDEIEPKAYHDLPDKEAELQLGAAEQGHVRGSTSKVPRTALEHYEKAVEKETQGSLGDSLKLYRKAFKLDDRVHEAYKNKHFPPSSFRPKPPQPNPSNAPATVPNPAHHSLEGLPPTIAQLVEDFSHLSIPGAGPPTDADPAPPCPIAELPEEILTQIFDCVAMDDVATFSPLARVCKRFAYLVMTEESIWKKIALSQRYGFASMHYQYACDLRGTPLAPIFPDEDFTLDDDLLTPDLGTPKPLIDLLLLKSAYSSSWRTMFRSRPRLRFGGCYISTVNYTRPGAASTTQVTWHTPVHIVTYFRYLRFFRDGTVISLLTTAEPVDVVHHLTKENLGHYYHPSGRHQRGEGSLLPNAVMKDALPGRWRLSGPGDGAATGEEAEGDVHVETEGVVPKYMWKMQFGLGSAGRGTRNNKLSWKGFWSYNRLTDDWGEFGLKNDKAYYWSRVKSYGLGY